MNRRSFLARLAGFLGAAAVTRAHGAPLDPKLEEHGLDEPVIWASHQESYDPPRCGWTTIRLNPHYVHGWAKCEGHGGELEPGETFGLESLAAPRTDLRGWCEYVHGLGVKWRPRVCFVDDVPRVIAHLNALMERMARPRVVFVPQGFPTYRGVPFMGVGGLDQLVAEAGPRSIDCLSWEPLA